MKTTFRVSSIFLPFIFAAICLLATNAVAQVPRTISYQGVLTNGGVAANGQHLITVALYDSLVGGTMLYQESQEITVSDGIFNIEIGAQSPIPQTLAFDQPYFLGVSVDGNPEMSPRAALDAAPYALNANIAEFAEGLTPDARGVVTSINELAGPLRITGDSITTVTEDGNDIIIHARATPGTAYTAGQGISISNDTISATGGLPPAGTVLNSTLRWNGTAWTENPDMTSDANGNTHVDGSTTLGNGKGADSITMNGAVTVDGFGQGVVLSSANGVLSSGLVDLSTDVTGILPVIHGGTGLDNLPNGELLVGNGTNPVSSVQLAAGSGISIAQNAGNIIITNTGSVGWGLNGNAGTSAATNFLGTTDNQALVIKTNSAEAMRVTNAGYVGIGTTTPVHMLNVVDNTGQNDAEFENNNSSIPPNYQAALDLNNRSASLAPTELCFCHYNTASVYPGYAVIDMVPNNLTSGSEAGSLVFATRTNGPTNVTEKMRITNDGKVGIGTSTPSEELNVSNGNFLLSSTGTTADTLQLQGTSSGISSFAAGAQGATTINYTLPTSQPSANQVLAATAVTGAGPYAVALGWSTPSGGGSAWNLTGNSGTTAGTNFIGTTDNTALVLKTNSVEHLRVLAGSSGGILIPSSASTAEQLQFQNPAASHVSSFAAGAQSADINYTLPASQPSANQVLTATSISGSGPYNVTTGWTNGSTFAWGLTGNSGTTVGTNFLGTTDNVNLQFRVNNTQAGLIQNGSTTGFNTALGYEALLDLSTGSYNTAMGYQTLILNTTGSYNTGIGDEALVANTTGQMNTAIGNEALQSNTSGQDNTAVGGDALTSNINSYGNTSIGFSSSSNTTGGFNTAVGIATLGTNTTGSDNTVIGYYADVASGGLTNATAIGTYAEAGANNTLVLGSIFGINHASADANVGIGTITPGQKFELENGNVLLSNSTGNADSLRFQGTGTGISSFAAGAQGTTTINYTLPTSQPSANQVLSATAISGSGPYAVTLGWASSSGGTGWSLTGNSGTTAGTNFLGTTDDEAFEIHVYDGDGSNNGSKRVMRYEPNATSANIIGGYQGNTVSSGVVGATISGGGANGTVNSITGNYCTIGGGISNAITGTYNTIAGGSNNGMGANYGTIGGGFGNSVSASYSTISGGAGNAASGTYIFVGGGISISTSANYSVVTGGQSNGASGSATYSAVGGGHFNNTGGVATVISGGGYNNAGGSYASIGGGMQNTTGGSYSAIPGGDSLEVGSSSFGMNVPGGSALSGIINLSSFSNIAYLGNMDLWLGNTDNSARALRFYSPGTSITYSSRVFSSFVAGSQSATINYTLPTSQPSANQVLSATAISGSGPYAVTLGWASAGSSSGWGLTGNSGTTPGTNFIGTTDDEAFEIHVYDSDAASHGSKRVMRFEPNVSSANIIGGYQGNAISGVGSVIAGGGWLSSPDSITGYYSAVGGGSANVINGYFDVIAGGTANSNIGSNSAIGGGSGHSISSSYSVIAGGSGNTASTNYVAIGGGASNSGSGQYGAIGGGLGNTIGSGGTYGTIGGGRLNTVGALRATVGGGESNTANGSYAVIGGGFNNTTAGYSAIPGGDSLTIGSSSFGMNVPGGSALSGIINLSSFSNIAYLGNMDLWLGNTDNSARALRFYTASTSETYSSRFYSSFVAGSQSATINYTLPTSQPSANQVLSATAISGSGPYAVTLGWASASGSGWGLTGNSGTTPGTNFLGTTDNTAFEIHVYDGDAANKGSKRVMRYEPNATSANIIGGSQSNTISSGIVGATIAGGGVSGSINSIGGNFSTIGGGVNNEIPGAFSVIAGGTSNIVAGSYSFIGSGYANSVSGSYSAITAGQLDTASGEYVTISGGEFNSASGINITISGGDLNYASGDYIFVGNGLRNSTSANYSVLTGGELNVASSSATYSVIGGGMQNTTGGSYSVIPGGDSLEVGASSFGMNVPGGSSLSSIINLSSFSNIAYLGNMDLWLGNTDNSARALRFYTASTSTTYSSRIYSSFVAGSQSATINYTLPLAPAGTTGNLLWTTSGASSAMSWTGNLVWNDANSYLGINTTTPAHPVHSVNAASTDEIAALYGIATASSTNQAIGAWGRANNTSSGNTGTIGVLATGNGNTTAGQTNVALQLNDGEFAMGRTTETPSVGSDVEPATGGTAYSQQGPSGIVELTLGSSGNLQTSAPTTGVIQDLGSVTINNRYTEDGSVVLTNVVAMIDDGNQPNPQSAAWIVNADNTASGSFVIRVKMIPAQTSSSNYSSNDKVRVGYVIVNKSK